jgi:hypothetical protein
MRGGGNKVQHVWGRREEDRLVDIKAGAASDDLRISEGGVEEGQREGGRGEGGSVRAQHSSREGNLLSALAMVIKATNGSAMSSKIERMFMGGGFVETGSRPA